MIGIISFLSPRYAQFIYKYTEVLEKNKIKYEVIYWNRENVDYGFNSNWIGYEKEINTFQPFYKKILGFIQYTKFMYKKIKERKYDKLIVLTSQTAIPLFPLLIGKYKNKYIYDYRDVTYENIFIYKKIVKMLIDSSFLTAISSEGFKKVLNLKDDKKIILSHNTREFDKKEIEKTYSDKIRIVYWGMIRQLEFNYKICDLFSNISEIELIYHGAGYDEELKKYCVLNNYKNIKFTGAYMLDEIRNFVENSDFVLNSYENDKQQQPAMTVKYYDSLMYGIPMIVNKNSFMSKKVESKKLGISVDWKNTNEVDEVIEEIKKFDYKEYQKCRTTEIENIKKDDKFFYDKLLHFCVYGGKNE